MLFVPFSMYPIRQQHWPCRNMWRAGPTPWSQTYALRWRPLWTGGSVTTTLWSQTYALRLRMWTGGSVTRTLWLQTYAQRWSRCGQVGQLDQLYGHKHMLSMVTNVRSQVETTVDRWVTLFQYKRHISIVISILDCAPDKLRRYKFVINKYISSFVSIAIWKTMK